MLPNFFSEIKSVDQAIHPKAVGPLFKKGYDGLLKSLNFQITLGSTLIDEFSDGVRMFGYHHNNKLIGVIGIQELKDVTLIRHAYTLTSFQGKGTGSALLEYLLKKNQNSRLLVGTWRNATWAIRFYEKFGFILHAKEQSTLLLKKYWKIPSKQIKYSVVLERF